MPGNCKFNEAWLQSGKWPWLLKYASDPHSAYCSLCEKKFSIASMGISSLSVHASGKKHKELVASRANRSNQISNYISSSASVLPTSHERIKTSSSQALATCSSSSPAAPSVLKPPVNQKLDLSSLSMDKERLTAEILWALKVVDSNYSFRSSEEMGDIFKMMFADSAVAKAFKCGETKCRYLVTYGLADYCEKVLCEKLRGEDFVLLFDEALNKKMEKKQMDIHVRFWNNDIVATRFYTSVFIGHSTARDILEELERCLNKLSHTHILQLGMDGPNVNHKVHRDLQENLKSETGKNMLNVGSCGLHTINGCFKTAVKSSAWDVDGILHAAYVLFKRTPARREDFTSVTGCTKFPKSFSYTRWLENAPAIEHFLLLLPHLRQYVSSVTKKAVPNPKTASYETVAAACKDQTLELKLNFVLSIAQLVQPFLLKFQSDKPLLSFLVPELVDLVNKLASRFIKTSVWDNIKTVTEIVNFKGFKTSENIKDKVSLGFVADRMMISSSLKKKVSDVQLFTLKREATAIMAELCTLIVQKSPMKYSTAKHLTCLDPRNMKAEPQICSTGFEKLLRTLSDSHWIPEASCQLALDEFNTFLTQCDNSFSEFNIVTQRLDEFLVEKMSKCTLFRNLWPVVRKLLLLSHGQASVERGFSINKNAVADNQTEESLIARRIVKDFIQAAGGLKKVCITNEMRAAAKGSRLKYEVYLEEQRKLQAEGVNAKKRKAEEHELSDMKAKVRRLAMDIEHCNNKAMELSRKCEETRDITFVMEANSLHRAASEKQSELNLLKKKLEKVGR